jgi:hypothetical protein
MIHSKEINRTQWKFIVWTPIILGGVIWVISSTLFSLSSKENVLLNGLFSAGLTAGAMLVGWGFGLVYARYFKIKGIDNE